MKTHRCKACGAAGSTADGRTPDGWYVVHRTTDGKRHLICRVCSVECAVQTLAAETPGQAG